ncbi:hypothetical protein B6E66_27425 [Streptomyces maremycinicus]|nr:hypothetical protein B6E66_27425 [Streptomyces sp. B9173]
MSIPGTWQKSSYSGEGDGNDCVELASASATLRLREEDAPGNWQKSSHSGGADGNDCVELASTPATLHLRESDAPGTILATTPAPLAQFLHAIRTGTPGIVASITARAGRAC